MSYKFGPKSLRCLAECDERLQQIANELIKEMDIAVICGHRNKKDQEDAVKRGVSKLHFPNSKHNSLPSKAMDIAPINRRGGISWDDIHAFRDMCSRVETIANRLGIEIRLGRDFSGLPDFPHVEIKD